MADGPEDMLLSAIKQGIHYKNTSTSRNIPITISYPIAFPKKTLFAIRTTYAENGDGVPRWNHDTLEWTSSSLKILIDYASHCADYYLLVVGV